MADPRLVAFLEQAGGSALVTADPGLVRMLAGHASDIETGPSPFSLPPVVIAPGEGVPILVCSADEAPDGDHELETYEGFTIGPLDPAAGAALAVARALTRLPSADRLIFDDASLPAVLAARLPVTARPAGWRLRSLGATKTSEEIAAIKASLALCTAGQRAARLATRPGASELELWAAVRAAIENAAGGRCALLADLVAGPRTGEVGGLPSPRRIADGELVLCDLVPRLDGIWGDSCATWFAGEPVPRARLLHAAASAGLEAALGALRPGVQAGVVDAAARTAVAAAGFAYPHHTGHGIGFRYHEEPRIVPHGPTVIEPGMVVALEPGAYEKGLGVRVEVVVLVTADGAQVLSTHPLGLESAEQHP